MEQLTEDEIYSALLLGGVSKWKGYQKAVDMAKSEKNTWLGLDPEERLAYLYKAGVKRWKMYKSSIEAYLQ